MAGMSFIYLLFNHTVYTKLTQTGGFFYQYSVRNIPIGERCTEAGIRFHKGSGFRCQCQDWKLEILIPAMNRTKV